MFERSMNTSQIQDMAGQQPDCTFVELSIVSAGTGALSATFV
jgi:hypothetical protein